MVQLNASCVTSYQCLTVTTYLSRTIFTAAPMFVVFLFSNFRTSHTHSTRGDFFQNRLVSSLDRQTKLTLSDLERSNSKPRNQIMASCASTGNLVWESNGLSVTFTGQIQ